MNESEKDRVEILPSTVEDRQLFKALLMEPDVLEYFPMHDEREIDDSVRIWEFFCNKGASITASFDREKCGLAFLNLQGYQKLAHQCLITIIVDKKHRNKGIGTKLIRELFNLAKTQFSMEMLHLEVYETNPAISLYRRMGFKEFGLHKKFIKEGDRYIGKILMEATLSV